MPCPSYHHTYTRPALATAGIRLATTSPSAETPFLRLLAATTPIARSSRQPFPAERSRQSSELLGLFKRLFTTTMQIIRHWRNGMAARKSEGVVEPGKGLNQRAKVLILSSSFNSFAKPSEPINHWNWNELELKTKFHSRRRPHLPETIFKSNVLFDWSIS